MHTPVLLEEVLRALDPQPGQKFIDATADGGGHAAAILERIVPGGKLLGIEIDPILFQQLQFKSSKFKDALIPVNSSYVNLQKIVEENGFWDADGILFDLGMSNWHLEQSGKGFSFQKDEILDMRYATTKRINAEVTESNANIDKTETAAEIINQYPREEIERILTEYGEEKFAGRIAEAVIKARKQKPIISTF